MPEKWARLLADLGRHSITFCPQLGHYYAKFALLCTFMQNLPSTRALVRKMCPPYHWDTCMWNLPFTGAHTWEIFPDKARFLTKIEGTLAQMGRPWPLRPTLCISPCDMLVITSSCDDAMTLFGAPAPCRALLQFHWSQNQGPQENVYKL